MTTGFTYFARLVGDRSKVKIGRSSAPIYRIKEIGYQYKASAELIAAVPSEHYELRFHALFALDHLGREWFAWSPRMAKAINSLLLGQFDLDELPPPQCLTRPKGRSRWTVIPDITLIDSARAA